MSRICKAYGDIRRSRFVTGYTTNHTVRECGIGELPLGISQLGSREAPLPNVTDDPALAATTGDAVEIHDSNASRQDVSLEIGVGGCAAFDLLISDSQGRGVVGSGMVGAMALASAAEGELCPVMLLISRGGAIPAVVYEFDCQTGVDAATHILIPAALNPTGLVIQHGFAIVTEQFAGSSEDQGIVTVEDTDGTDLFTLTASDAGADALNDIIQGYSAPAASTGAAAKVVAADKGVRGLVTQATSGGSPAGKMKVILVAFAL